MKTHLSSDITIGMVNFVMMNLNNCNSMPLFLSPNAMSFSLSPNAYNQIWNGFCKGFRLGFSHRQGFFGLKTNTIEQRKNTEHGFYRALWSPKPEFPLIKIYEKANNMISLNFL